MSVKKLKECDRLSLALSDMKLPTRLVLLALTVMLVLVMLLVLSSIGAVDKARFISLMTSGRPPPHIVFIVADDLGWNDVGWHNPLIKTPNLDRLAAEGVTLNASYMFPICSPSRASFMTGYYAFRTGLQHIPIIHFKTMYLPSRFTLLPELLKRQGYATHVVGKWHLGFCNWRYTPRRRGFDSFLGYLGGQEGHYNHSNGKVEEGYDLRFNEDILPDPNQEYGEMLFARRAVEIIDNHNPKKPLFLYLPLQAVHSPIEAPQRFLDLYPDTVPDYRQVYSGMVSVIDEFVGNVTSALERRGFMDNLLLIFTSDNGATPEYAGNNWPLRGGKFSLWEGGTRVPGFVYSRTLLKKTGYTSNELIHAVDWFPTILHLAGKSAGDHVDGLNLWRTLSEGEPSPRTEFVYNIDEVDQNAAIRMGDYKLIVGEPGRFNDWYPLPQNGTPLPEEYPLWKLGRFQKLFPEYQLYNVKDDPTEKNDLAEEHPELVQTMLQRLKRYQRLVVPSQNPGVSAASLPHNFGGVWSPGWC
ncbi:arylsulfatase B-like [Pomacea canaliculata]|uniref:arylsulfatase B-like n=1 Tax=Pomacea canaliculata TaxID=400727 RepID=UPI000D72CF6F|nr:arylsulfatase B-like [Pomacea canaliculata]